VSSVALPLPPAKFRKLVLDELGKRNLAPPLTVPDFWTSQSHSTIRTQHGVQPFVPFEWQREFVNNITPREMILKSRDVGSSEICVRYFCWRQLSEGGNILIKADRHDNAKNLIKIAKQYLTSLPDGERPVLIKDNETELELQGIGTIKAMAQGGGRSERCKYLLKTERAFWERSAEEEAAISGALVAGGWLIQESTANGFNDFHEDWMDAANGYRKTFVGRGDNPTHDAAWWAQKQDELAKLGKTVEQEYPQTDQESFIASGNCVFDKAAIIEYLAGCRVPAVTAQNGAISIWVKPVVATQYVAGADVAEGIDVGNDRLDYSHMAILEYRSGKHVASLHGQWPPDVFAGYCHELGKQYGFPYLAVERNNHGLTVLTKLKELGYPNLHWEVSPEQVLRARREGKHANAILGWRTTAKSKPQLESDYGAAIMAQDVTSYDKRLWDQCLSYVQHGDGSTGAQSNTHDDIVIAHMIAWQMRRYYRPRGALPISVNAQWSG